MDIRHAKEDDASGILDLYEALDSETEFMFFEPGERNTTVDEVRARIQRSLGSDSFALYVAAEGATVVGFCAGFSNIGKRNQHVSTLVIGVRQSSWSKGVGRQLMHAVEAWAHSKQKTKLELTVMLDNERAIVLYESLGFEREGLKRRSVRLEHGYRDELHMGKPLD